MAAPNSTSASPGQRAVEGEWPEAPSPNPEPNLGSEADDPSEPPVPTDIDMPPIESLDVTSDLSGFFSKGVSASLRRAALRHVFSQPSYNVRDGLNDYDGDYTVFEPLGDTVTSDMKFHAARHERERLRREAEAEADGRIETSSTDEAGSMDEAGADGAEPEGRAVAEADRGSSTAERDSTAEADADGDDERDGLPDEVRTHRTDAFRDEVTSIGTDERSPSGTRTSGGVDVDDVDMGEEAENG